MRPAIELKQVNKTRKIILPKFAILLIAFSSLASIGSSSAQESIDGRPNGVYTFLRVYPYTLSAMAGLNYERQVYAWPKGKILARIGGAYSGGFEYRGPVYLGDMLAAFGQKRSKFGVGIGYLGFIHNTDGLFEAPLFYSFTFNKGFSFSFELDPAIYRDTDQFDPTRIEFQIGLQFQVGYCF